MRRAWMFNKSFIGNRRSRILDIFEQTKLCVPYNLFEDSTG